MKPHFETEHPSSIPRQEREVTVSWKTSTITGDLVLPERAEALVIFAHGSGSSRFSPRNRYVAGILQEGGFGTFLLDLLTEDEDRNYNTRFNIGLLVDRLVAAVEWAEREPSTRDLSLAFFGSSTGAAAALQTAAALGSSVISSVVSRGGRPDLAGDSLQWVFSPTLLIVGGSDAEVVRLNQQAFTRLGTYEKELHIVPHATHLFEEPGALEEVAQVSRSWFQTHA